MAKLSIIIPVFNVEKYIERCARSLFEQTYNDIEYIFINDRTPDNSISILQQILLDYPNRKNHVRIINQHQNQGASAARNVGIEISTGNWIMFVDSDDYLPISSIDSIFSKINEVDSDMFMYGYFNLVNETVNNEFLPNYTGYLNINNIKHVKLLYHQMWNYVVKRDTIVSANIKFTETAKYAEDTEFMVRAVLSSKNIYCINKALYFYNNREGSATSNVSIVGNNDHLIMANAIININPQHVLTYYTSTSLIIRFIDCATLIKHKSRPNDYHNIGIILKSISDLRCRILKNKAFLDARSLYKIKYPVLYYFYLKYIL